MDLLPGAPVRRPVEMDGAGTDGDPGSGRDPFAGSFYSMWLLRGAEGFGTNHLLASEVLCWLGAGYSLVVGFGACVVALQQLLDQEHRGPNDFIAVL